MAGWKFWSRTQAAQPALDPAQAALLGLQKSEARLWISAAVATTLTLIGFVAAYLPRTADPLFASWHLEAGQVAPALLGLFLLFHVHLLHRRWGLRQKRKELLGADTAQPALPGEDERPAMDPVTGLSNARAAEEQLARELVASKKSGEPLSLLVVSLDDMKSIAARNGEAVANRALQDFARQLRRATRGTDFAVRMSSDEFLAVLPGCPVKSVPRVVERLGPVLAECSGAEIQVNYSTAWVDSEPGESPGQFVTRARKMLRLYQAVEREAVAS